MSTTLITPIVAEPGSRSASAAAAAEVGDAELVERVRGGDGAAFDVLVERHMRRAFSIAYRLLGQREDAEDLVQDAFLAVLRKIDSFQPERSFSAWFHRIVVNRALNARKARSVRHTEALPAEVRADGVSPLHHTERVELRERLAEVMTRLPERQRTIVRLSELEGMSSPEIAEILGLSDGTVRWHLHQARGALRQALAPFVRRNS
jgi:RNA polymerase sigma-70 factor (ECF subfamily)